MTELSEFHQDAIAELLNIGMGSAAAALSEMVGEEVGLSVPGVTFFVHKDAIEHLKATVGDEISAVRERFDGVFWGDAILLFPANQSQRLLSALLGETVYAQEVGAASANEAMSELEQEGMLEVGNIILNACVGSLANIFGQNLHYQLPELIKGASEDVLGPPPSTEDSDQGVLLLHMDFILKQAQVNGYLTLLMDVNSMQALVAQVDGYVSGMT